jgi:formamidopyrimidine-DNA glycosylase
MPELPEVQTVVNTLRPKVLGLRIARVELRRRDFVHPGGCDLPGRLTGQRISDIRRRGKRIVITLADANCFYIHLGMTGRLTIQPTSVQPRAHTHLILHFDQIELHLSDPRRFGGVWWVGSGAQSEQMGPEPLTLRPKQLAQRLSNTRRAIKNALLDQNLIAGLGNIYVDESLHAAGVHPLTPANELDWPAVLRLNRGIKSTLRRALRHRGSTLRDYVDAEGGPGAFQKLHRVYDRAGQPCRECKSSIVRIVLGGRSTCFCPKCQRA